MSLKTGSDWTTTRGRRVCCMNSFPSLLKTRLNTDLSEYIMSSLRLIFQVSVHIVNGHLSHSGLTERSQPQLFAAYRTVVID